MDNITIQQAQTSREARELFIKAHFPFIIYTVSSVTGRYVVVENDESFSIALEAFNGAIDTYSEGVSKFETYATTVIKNKLIDFYRQQKKHYGHEPLEETIPAPERDDDLRIEIADLSSKLSKFGLSFDDLVEVSPTHQDTREKAITVGIKASKIEWIVKRMHEILKLPVVEVVKAGETTRRFVYSHKDYILTVILVFSEDLTRMQQFILDSIKGDSHEHQKR